jgi:hypothetical protein
MNGVIRHDEQACGNREKHTPFALDKAAVEARFGLACFYSEGTQTASAKSSIRLAKVKLGVVQ